MYLIGEHQEVWGARVGTCDDLLFFFDIVA
jgi:hypothetical protein